jgi:[glutamine synthetase] adenylyltransferase / [glutamine synthetase]-adenylyl-L-tyrosine phosphorylase
VARLASLLEAVPELGRADLAEALVAICGASRALPGIASSLGDEAANILAWEAPAPVTFADGEPGAALRRGVAAHLLGIAALDLTGRLDMPGVGRALSEVADAAAGLALQVATGDSATRVAVIALGKWGGSELNYASDIDLVMVHEGDEDAAVAATARLIDLLSSRSEDGIAFRSDLDLRPRVPPARCRDRSSRTLPTGSDGRRPGSSRRC